MLNSWTANGKRIQLILSNSLRFFFVSSLIQFVWIIHLRSSGFFGILWDSLQILNRSFFSFFPPERYRNRIPKESQKESWKNPDLLPNCHWLCLYKDALETWKNAKRNTHPHTPTHTPKESWKNRKKESLKESWRRSPSQIT